MVSRVTYGSNLLLRPVISPASGQWQAANAPEPGRGQEPTPGSHFSKGLAADASRRPGSPAGFYPEFRKGLAADASQRPGSRCFTKAWQPMHLEGLAALSGRPRSYLQRPGSRCPAKAWQPMLQPLRCRDLPGTSLTMASRRLPHCRRGLRGLDPMPFQFPSLQDS